MPEQTTPDEIVGLSINLTTLALQLTDKADEIAIEEHQLSILILLLASNMVDIAKRLNEAETPKAFDVKLGKQFIKAVSKTRLINPFIMERVNESFK